MPQLRVNINLVIGLSGPTSSNTKKYSRLRCTSHYLAYEVYPGNACRILLCDGRGPPASHEMRNLRNIACRQTTLPDNLPLSAKSWDTNVDAIICAFGPTKEQPIIELKRKASNSDSFTDIASWDAPCPLPDLESDDILLLQYFADIQTACLVLAGGDIIVVREEPLPGQERIEIVGSVDVGITAAAWAPDEELLAIVTRGDTLVLMSRDFEPVTETGLSAEDLKASKHVSVGWGKKETQFQGKRAKAMRDPTMPESVDEGKPSPQDDGKTTISWRGDGQYFAVNGVIQEHRRVIRVFSREAVLDSASEPVDGLESALSWRPYGNLIAGIKRSSQKAEVVFFERNGLRHGEFDLRLSEDDIQSWASRIELSWNVDSTVLAVGYLDRLQLWTMGNYHYYLKQEVLLPTDNSHAALKPQWHPEVPLRLQTINGRRHLDLTYHFRVNRGSLLPGIDYGAVAVIDGKVLKLTPLRQAGVPPPMAFCEVAFDYPITDCAVSPDGTRIAVLTTDTLELCVWEPMQSNGTPTPASGVRFGSKVSKQIVESTDLKSALSGNIARQIELCGQELYILVSTGEAGSQLYRVAWANLGSSNLAETIQVPFAPQYLVLDSRQELVAAAADNLGHVISKSDAHVLCPELIGSLQPDTTLFMPPPPASRTNGTMQNGHDEVYHSISLSTKGILRADSTVLARDCSSFVVTDAHIIFTTTQQLLKFVHLAEPDSMEVPGNTPEADERCRSIERGAKLVTAISSAYAVVLQMPRGNLETIYPRVLVLSGIRKHIANLDYRTAFLACQNQQVDMNILHDYQPQAFMDNIVLFIQQLKKPSRVDEFISKLKEEDVTETLYRDTLKAVAAPPQAVDMTAAPVKPKDKVNNICEAFIAALSSLDSSASYTQNIITAHVCKRPPDLTAALSLILTIHNSSPTDADLAISHLCFLTDTTRLYNAALSIYSLELALLVAQNSQRDPREYMPFLQSLHALPTLRRHYTIDNHLRNYEKALQSLHALEDHEAVETYTLKHSLYAPALTLYKYDQAHLTTLTRHYASHLASTNQPFLAAQLYASLSDHTAAFPLYALAHSWREALTSATLASLPESQVSALANQLATTLTDESPRDYRAAAYIHEHYLSSPLEAARLLCKGSYFADASLLLSRTVGISGETGVIDPALSEQTGAILALLADMKSQCAAQVTRIAELRRIKETDPLAFFGGDALAAAEAGVDIADNISLAPTDTTVQNSLFTRAGTGSRFGGTAVSGASRKTSKTKRKEERKRARGKKGSVYEEEYLVASVGRLVERWNGLQGEVRRLVGGLGRRGRREEAREVQERMGEVGEVLGRARGQVWGDKVEEAAQEKSDGLDGKGVGVAGARPSGADGVFWDSQQEGGEGMKKPPEVAAWKAGEVFV